MTDLVHLLERYKFDRTKETEGVWHTIPLSVDHALEVKIARKTNQAYRDRLLANIIPLLGEVEKGEKPEDDQIGRAWAETMAGTMLVDWKGLELNGEPVEFSEEAAIVLLTELPEFRDEVMKRAGEHDKYLEDNLEAVADRLGKTLSGTSSTEALPENQESEPE